MKVLSEVDLSDYSTMRLGGQAKNVVEVYSLKDVVEACDWANDRNLDVIAIGHGSNVVWRDGIHDPLIMLNRIKTRVFDHSSNNRISITYGGGETWDEMVKAAVENGLTGVEALSAIPGSVGAAPVQNIGAFGQELSNTLQTVVAYDRREGVMTSIPASECSLDIRTSRFKAADYGRFVITSVRLDLSYGEIHGPLYGSLQSYLDENGITDRSPATIRRAVMNIRSQTLPDFRERPNCGSFFLNPVLEDAAAENLKRRLPEIPVFRVDRGRFKFSAAWLIEKAGFKGFIDADTGMAVSPNHALILINYRARTTSDLVQFAEKVSSAVFEMSGVELELEPELLPRQASI